MIVDRYYYDQLSEPEKRIYRSFYKGVNAHKEFIPLPKGSKVSMETVHKIFCAMTDDNPLIYFVNQSAISIAEDMFGNVAIVPQYFFTEEMIAQYNKKIQDAVNTLAVKLKLTEGSEYEKELKVHDYLCQYVSYDYSGTDLGDIGRVIASHNIIGVFAHRTAQCEGIAKAVKVLLNAVDVKCIVVSGKAKDDSGQWVEHAWNMVNLGGTPYQLDVTWDIGASLHGEIAYDYFNVPDAWMKTHHIEYGELPDCISEEWNYFRKNKRIFSTKIMLKNYISKQIKKGNRMLYFRLAGGQKAAKIADEMGDFAGQILLETEENVNVSKIVNENMNTCRITLR